MKFSVVLKRLFTGACVYYSAFSLALLLINVVLAGGTDGRVIGVLNVLLLFPFSLALSAAEFIRKNDKLSGAVRMLLHYFIFTAAFMLFLWLPSKTSKSVINVLLTLFLLTVLYWLTYLICHFTKKRFHSFKEEA